MIAAIPSSPPPANPVQAVVHPDPYPYYAALRAGPALGFDPDLRLWVAASAAAVAQVLEHPQLRVRPAAEPVPRAIAGAPAGELFGQLVRMNDGPRHEAPKLALQRALAALDAGHVLRRASAIAAAAASSGSMDLHSPQGLTQWVFEVPVSITADLLGFAPDELPRVAAWVADFVACLSPLSTPQQLAGASVAAQALLARLRQLVQASSAGPGSLVSLVQCEADAAGWRDADALLANLAGLMSQTHEATAGLLGSSIVAWMTHADAREALARSPALFGQWVQEAGRHDPPVQNTRRFAAAPVQVCGTALQAGDAVLVLLAAANRDPQANARPDEFLLERPARRVFGFGQGRHACPGQTLAQAMAAAALQVLLQARPALHESRIAWGYRPSANGRLPVFSG